MNTTTVSPARLRGLARTLFGVLAFLFICLVVLEIAVRGFEAWNFITAALGFSLFLLYSAATGRRFWPYTK